MLPKIFARNLAQEPLNEPSLNPAGTSLKTSEWAFSSWAVFQAGFFKRENGPGSPVAVRCMTARIPGLQNALNVKLQTSSLPPAPLPKAHYKTRTTEHAIVAQGKQQAQQGPCTTTMTTMITARGSKES